MPFTVTIKPCDIYSFDFTAIYASVSNTDTLLSDGGSYDYILGSPETIFYFYQKESPGCSKPHNSVIQTINGNSPSVYTWGSLANTGFQLPATTVQSFAITSSSTTDVGTYTLSV
jgi:hypothetical protein